MRPPSSPRAIAAAVGCLVLLAVAVPLWPQALGGSSAYVVPRGASMEPKLSDGDLAFVRAQDSYRVGDVVAYRNTALHRVVVHRIVAIQNGTYAFKGDANSFRDPQTVHAGQVVGRLAFSVPLLGGLLLWLTTPVNALLIVAFGVLLARDRSELLAAMRRPWAPSATATAPVAEAPDPVRRMLAGSDRIVPINDMSFPHELAVAEVVRAESLLRLAERYDRPVLHDEINDVLFVVESSMLYRCVVSAAVSSPAPALSLVRDEPSAPAAAVARSTVAEDRERRHSWPRRRDYGGRRKPTPQGRDWAYASGK